ncbi:MAG: phospholipid/cholesterol/gamma-HCH transport system ATP-binding protein [Chthoniobacter sp.]|jgi:phospholipid/cholesterol/gamma-HCH transport system ATP-binding protein|nr:phospholipid/cholesterol/gamma-HCH transport system ATP-binding protein [Chthoniobacter sp.]
MIAVRHLTKTLGSQQVLRGIDLQVKRGDTCVVLGRSGSGKSVLLKHLIGLFKPNAGEVWVDGEEISRLPERQLGPLRKKVGILFQSGALFDSMNVGENIAFPLRESGLKDAKEIADRVAEALEMVDLAGEQEKMPENLSGGMRKRVGLARTIVSRPACLLYDEPTTGLDPIATDSINRLIRRLQKRLAVTSVVVTHDMKTAFHTADQVTFLYEGRIYFDGTSDQLRASPDPVIQDFILGRSGDSD